MCFLFYPSYSSVQPLSDDELVRQHDKVIYEGVAEGVAIGLGISLPGSFLLNRRWAYYRSLPLSLKALGVVIVTVPALVIQTERKSLAFTRARWSVELIFRFSLFTDISVTISGLDKGKKSWIDLPSLPNTSGRA